MTAGNTFRPTADRVMLTPLMFPMRMPPTADTTAATHQEMANTFLTEMPMDRATWLLLAVALMAIPIREYLKKRAKSTRNTMEAKKV